MVKPTEALAVPDGPSLFLGTHMVRGESEVLSVSFDTYTQPSGTYVIPYPNKQNMNEWKKNVCSSQHGWLCTCNPSSGSLRERQSIIGAYWPLAYFQVQWETLSQGTKREGDRIPDIFWTLHVLLTHVHVPITYTCAHTRVSTHGHPQTKIQNRFL